MKIDAGRYDVVLRERWLSRVPLGQGVLDEDERLTLISGRSLLRPRSRGWYVLIERRSAWRSRVTAHASNLLDCSLLANNAGTSDKAGDSEWRQQLARRQQRSKDHDQRGRHRARAGRESNSRRCPQ